MTQMGDIDASRRDVGRDQITQLALTRSRHDFLALPLRKVAVEPIRRETRLLQLLRDSLGLTAQITENNRAFGVFDLENRDQIADAIFSRDDVDVMSDFLRAYHIVR